MSKRKKKNNDNLINWGPVILTKLLQITANKHTAKYKSM
jgi:hypothetical protein